MTRTLDYTEQLTVTTCWCGMAHAIPTALYDFVHRKHDQENVEQWVYCPLGHKWTPAGRSKLDREREIREAAEAREIALLDQLNAERRAHNTTKAKARTASKKAATRAKNGVCPHPECHRSFVDVARHVRSKHPELVTP